MFKIKVDVLKKEVRVSKAAYKAMCLVGSAEYDEFQKVLQSHPGFEIVIESRKTTSDPFKFLTFDYMEKYIAGHDNDTAGIMNEYMELRGLSEEAREMGAVSYTLPQMKEWFLDKYPAVRNYHNKRAEARQKLSSQHKEAIRKAA